MRPAQSVMTKSHTDLITFLAATGSRAALLKKAAVQQGMSFDPRYGVANKAKFIATATMYDAAARLAAE